MIKVALETGQGMISSSTKLLGTEARNMDLTNTSIGKFDLAFLGCGTSNTLLLAYMLQNCQFPSNYKIAVIDPHVDNIGVYASDQGKASFLRSEDRTRWPGTYGCFKFPLSSSWLKNFITDQELYLKQWSEVSVIDIEGNKRQVKDSREPGRQTYCIVNKHSLIKKCDALIAKFVSNENVELMKGNVQQVIEIPEKNSCKIFYSNNEESKQLEARQVVHGLGLAVMEAQNGLFPKLKKPPGMIKLVMTKRYQTFLGEELYFDSGHGLDINNCVLMDYSRCPSSDQAEDDPKLPRSFGYIMPLDHKRLFMEEIMMSIGGSDKVQSLDFRNEPTIRLLQRLLSNRKRKVFSTGDIEQQIQERSELLYRECYTLPMGGQFPVMSKNGMVIFIGEAGNFSHPASGYMLDFLIKQIPILSKTLITRTDVSTHSAVRLYSRNVIWQAWFNDLGSYMLHDLNSHGEDLYYEKLSSEIILGIFETPQWLEFMTRDESLSPSKYIFNMLRLAKRLGYINPRYLMTLFRISCKYCWSHVKINL